MKMNLVQTAVSLLEEFARIEYRIISFAESSRLF